jgi:hypothetical protein
VKRTSTRPWQAEPLASDIRIRIHASCKLEQDIQLGSFVSTSYRCSRCETPMTEGILVVEPKVGRKDAIALDRKGTHSW